MRLRLWPYGRMWRRVRRSSIAWWVITVVLALTTASVIGSAVGRATDAADAWGTAQSVWVMRRAVVAGDVIADADVEATTRPRGVVPDGALDMSSSPVGEAARVTLVPGEVVLTNRLAGHGASGIAAVVPPGHRAVAVPPVDAMPQLVVGDRVDVLATFDVGDEFSGGSSSEPSFAVASDVEVLAISSRAITLAVESRDAARVAFALAKAAVTLVLRSPLTSEIDGDDREAGEHPIDDEGREGLRPDELQ